jgi:formylglycine-generating enzyme required for sulfatase activity
VDPHGELIIEEEPKMTQRSAAWLFAVPLLTGCIEQVQADTGNIEPVHGIEFVRIQGHTFDMGCTPGMPYCHENELPVQQTTLTRDFHMSRTEVTQEQFEAVMGYNPSQYSDCGPTCPVEDLSWDEAAAFANEVSAAAGLPECFSCKGSGTAVTCTSSGSVYDCGGFRLPTEAEWEGAARCGEDLMYAGSDISSEVGWFQEDPDSTIRPVGELLPNSCGLLDMSGNVWEWTQDWYADYRGSASIDPDGPPPALRRVFRGGSFVNVPLGAWVACRLAAPPSSRGQVGVRLVRTAD